MASAGAEDPAEEASEEVEEGAGSLSLESPTAGLSLIALLQPGHEMMALASIWRPPVSSSRLRGVHALAGMAAQIAIPPGAVNPAGHRMRQAWAHSAVHNSAVSTNSRGLIMMTSPNLLRFRRWLSPLTITLAFAALAHSRIRLSGSSFLMIWSFSCGETDLAMP